MPHISVRAPTKRAQEQGEEGQPLPRLRQVLPERGQTKVSHSSHAYRRDAVPLSAMQRGFRLVFLPLPTRQGGALQDENAAEEIEKD